MTVEIDHIFLLIDPEAPIIQQCADAGLVETYRRIHPGQGTRNICFAFENAYLELLWVCDWDEVESPPIARTQLGHRARGIGGGACPFGLAWRGAPGAKLGIPNWPYRPPYLPPEHAIEVADDSDHWHQPFMFSFPGSQAPTSWPEARRGTLQKALKATTLIIDRFTLPEGVAAGHALQVLADRVGFLVQTGQSKSYQLDLTISRESGLLPLALTLDETNLSLMGH